MDEEGKNDFDRIAEKIDEAMAAFIGNAHEGMKHTGDSITMTKDGFIKGVIRLQRLRDWCEGLAETSRNTANIVQLIEKEIEDIEGK